ncbi:MAG TPA: hypothetical protein VLC98_08765 [Phnomibacter sp.]|nr:hypothetical protein [Phnomibacter sp.]
MKKFIVLTLVSCMATAFAIAQQYEPAPSPLQTKLENYIGRYGTPERVYLNDVKKETFDAIGGEMYTVVFVYNINTKSKRRMMVYELGPNGQKINPKYPNYSKSIRPGDNAQLFNIRLNPTTNTTYKIDPDTAATVYIYKLIPGVKH